MRGILARQPEKRRRLVDAQDLITMMVELARPSPTPASEVNHPSTGDSVLLQNPQKAWRCGPAIVAEGGVMDVRQIVPVTLHHAHYAITPIISSTAESPASLIQNLHERPLYRRNRNHQHGL
jgi:hypothetical protein